MKRYKQWLGAGVIGAAALLVGMNDAKAAVPDTVAFAGRLSNADGLVDGNVTVVFRIFDAASNGSSVWTESHDVVADHGLVLVDLGSDAAFDATVFDGSDRYLEIEVEGEVLSPRALVGSVPYAMHAGEADHTDVADHLGALGEADVQKRITGGCNSNESIQSIQSDGSVTCQQDDDTTYTAGAGITLAGTTFAADLGVVQARVSGSCGTNQSIQSIDAAGNVTCETDDDTAYTGSGGITVNGSTIGRDASVVQSRVGGTCGTNQAIKAVAQDGTVTCEAENITAAGSGLSLSNGVVSIPVGGVGSTQLLDGSVFGIDITDNTITNVDISVNANIDPAKIGIGPSSSVAQIDTTCVGVIGIRSFMPLTVCIAGDADGPSCSSVSPGQLCEADGECGATMQNFNNCGNAEWFIRVQ